MEVMGVKLDRKGAWEFLKLVRLDNLVLLWFTQYMTRTFLIGPSTHWWFYLQDTQLALLIFAAACIVAGGFVINDYYDVKIDTINYPNKVVVGRTLKRRAAILWHSLLSLIGIIIGFSLSWELGIVNVVCAVLVWLYSNQLKRQPLVGNLSLGVLSALAILAVGIYYNALPTPIWMFACLAYFMTVIRSIIKDMADRRGDMHFGCRTLPIIWGIRKTKGFIYVLIVTFLPVVAVCLWIIHQPWLNYYFMATAITLMLFIHQLYWADTTKAYLRLNTFCKWWMLSGIIAMALV